MLYQCNWCGFQELYLLGYNDVQSVESQILRSSFKLSRLRSPCACVLHTRASLLTYPFHLTCPYFSTFLLWWKLQLWIRLGNTLTSLLRSNIWFCRCSPTKNLVSISPTEDRYVGFSMDEGFGLKWEETCRLLKFVNSFWYNMHSAFLAIF
jgi:hypothetical protein